MVSDLFNMANFYFVSFKCQSQYLLSFCHIVKTIEGHGLFLDDSNADTGLFTLIHDKQILFSTYIIKIQ